MKYNKISTVVTLEMVPIMSEKAPKTLGKTLHVHRKKGKERVCRAVDNLSRKYYLLLNNNSLTLGFGFIGKVLSLACVSRSTRICLISHYFEENMLASIPYPGLLQPCTYKNYSVRWNRVIQTLQNGIMQRMGKFFLENPSQ